MDGLSEYFSLPDESPRTVRIYLEFLKTGRLHHPDSDEDETTDRKLSFSRIVRIFKFAGDFGIVTLRNAALNSFFLRIYENPDRLPYQYISSIYKATSPDSSLRHLAVDVIVNIGTKTDVQEWMDELPKQFLMDCLTSASEDDTVAFPGGLSEDDIVEWLEHMKNAMCETFHVHDYRSGNQRQVFPLEFPEHKMSYRAKKKENIKEEAADDEAQAQSVNAEYQKIFDEESAARMKYLMEPLPAKDRH